MSEATVPPARTGEHRQQALREELRQLADVVGPGPLVDLLLERAFQIGATDIHLDPDPEGLRVRLRVDGLLHDVVRLPPAMTPNVISRVKLMADMDIAEKRLAQDGHIANTMLQHERDVRVGSGPTIYGERLVLRLMPEKNAFTHLEELGLEDDQLQLLRRHAAAPYGMVLCVGPVGSGKSTTIYSCLRHLNDPAKSLVTIEDPVERRIEGVNQIQVENKISFGFVEALRGVLRQDPNVMMVGEIRDAETAHIACRAAISGVMVLSTMHANDTASTLSVLRELGLPPIVISESLTCIVAQRLIRKVCPESRETWHPDAAACHALGIDPALVDSVDLVRGIPTDANFHTGYSGRTGIFEVMPVDADIRQAILRGKSYMEIQEIARANGMVTLEQAARHKVLAGHTSLEELHRVLATSAR